jgi:hypothetical protein
MSKKNGHVPYSIGTKVETVGHVHPDVLPMTIGVVTDILEGGYGVEFRQQWVVAGSDRGALVTETRTVWMPPKNLKVVAT